MRILVAPQELKGTLTAREAASALKDGVMAAGFNEDVLEVAPLADGGPGTLDALLCAGGERWTALVEDPLGREVEAAFGLLPDGTGVVEMAQASGLWRLGELRTAPDLTRRDTFGTGQLMRAALDAGASRLWVTLGGSATGDGGAGALLALGVRLHGYVRGDLFSLGRVTRVDLGEVDPRLRQVPLALLTDVKNPLQGPTGATSTYARQKGVDEASLPKLEAALAHFAQVLEAACGRRARDLEGAGAAGGLGFGLSCALGAPLSSGFEAVARALRLEERLRLCDHVLTAEGRLDVQTGFGKGPAALAGLARRAGVSVTLFTGSVTGDADPSVFSQVLASGRDFAALREAARLWRRSLSPRGDGAPHAP